MTAEQYPPLPPASDRQGNAGHDQALEMANGVELLTLRAAGLTYAQIAREKGYSSASGARQALLRALDRHEAENALELRALENMRLDSDERVLRTIISDASVPAVLRIRAIDSRTRLSARRSRLNGMDAPVQVEVSSGVMARLEDVLGDAETVIMGLVTNRTDDTTGETLPPALEA